MRLHDVRVDFSSWVRFYLVLGSREQVTDGVGFLAGKGEGSLAFIEPLC